jgi:hypothetical protein
VKGDYGFSLFSELRGDALIKIYITNLNNISEFEKIEDGI